MANFTNTNDEDFGDVTGGAITISHAQLVFDIGGANHRVAWTGALTNARELQDGDPMQFNAGSFDFNFPNAAAEDAFMKDLLDVYEAQRGDPTVLLGTGALAAGAAGAYASAIGNEIPSGRGYTRQVMEITTGTGVLT